MPIGAVLIEKSIIKKMFARLKERVPESRSLSNDEFDFVKSVAYARRIFDERTSEETR
jgi:hypothetical protein